MTSGARTQQFIAQHTFPAREYKTSTELENF